MCATNVTTFIAMKQVCNLKIIKWSSARTLKNGQSDQAYFKRSLKLFLAYCSQLFTGHFFTRTFFILNTF